MNAKPSEVGHSNRLVLAMIAVSSASGTSVLTTLLIGLLIACAVQLLSIGFYGVVAVTLFHWPRRPILLPLQDAPRPAQLKHGLGAVLLLTVNGVMGVACYFAVNLSSVSSSLAGAILGTVIWSAYLLLWLWLSWKILATLLGKSVGIFRAGISLLLPSLLGSRRTPTVLELQTQLAAQQSRLIDLQLDLQQQLNRQTGSTQGQDLTSGNRSGNDHPVWQQVEDYVSDPTQKLTTKAIHQHLASLVQPFEQAPERLPLFNRQAIEQSLAARSDLSSKRQARVADRFETAWNDLVQPLEAEDSTTPEPPEPAQTDLREAGWLGLVVLLVQTSLDALALEDWAGDQLSQKRHELTDWITIGRQTVRQRLDDLQQQMTQSIQATQQTGLTVAWWVLATALTSGLTAVAAGAMAVQ